MLPEGLELCKFKYDRAPNKTKMHIIILGSNQFRFIYSLFSRALLTLRLNGIYTFPKAVSSKGVENRQVKPHQRLSFHHRSEIPRLIIQFHSDKMVFKRMVNFVGRGRLGFVPNHMVEVLFFVVREHYRYAFGDACRTRVE